MLSSVFIHIPEKRHQIRKSSTTFQSKGSKVKKSEHTNSYGYEDDINKRSSYISFFVFLRMHRTQFLIQDSLSIVIPGQKNLSRKRDRVMSLLGWPTAVCRPFNLNLKRLKRQSHVFTWVAHCCVQTI